MTDATGLRPPLGIRLLHAVRKEPDWSTMSAEALDSFSAAENRRRASALLRVITGFPDRGVAIGWEQIVLPDRVLRVRVYRPSRAGNSHPEKPNANSHPEKPNANSHPAKTIGHGDPAKTAEPRGAGLPLVLHVHGGGFVGTAVQSDWINSHLAARLPALVVSVEHRLLTAQVPLSAAVDDGWDVLRHLLQEAERWGVDRARVAVLGESAGSMVTGLSAIRARDTGLRLRAQVLVNPCVDLTDTALDYPSVRRYADSPTLTVRQIELFRRLAVPRGSDPRAVSPLYAEDLSGLAPALVAVPTFDPVADHGRTYAGRLRAAGTPTQLNEYPGATHAFLSTPGIVPQARAARADITEFLRRHLGA